MKLYKKPTSANWYARFVYKGQPYKTSCHTSVKRDAERYAGQWRADLERELDEGTAQPPAKLVPTLAVLRDLDVARLREEGRNEGYIVRGVINNYKWLIQYFPGVEAVTDISLQDYVKHRRAKGIRRQTIAKELVCLKRGFRLAKWPAPDYWPKLASDEADARRANKEHDLVTWRAWLSALDGEAKDLALFALLTGLRHAELYRVQPEDINAAGVLTVREKVKRKNNKRRKVVLSPVARAVAARSIPFKANHKKAFKTAAKNSPTGNITLRDCRAAFATAADTTGDSRITNLAMGHGGIPERYQHRDIQRLSNIAEAVERWLLAPATSNLVNLDKQ